MVEDVAIASLFQAPLEQFVPVRKQLSAELKAAGDKEGAARLLKLKRPTLSVWVVNQLWWLEQGSFEALLASARRISTGDLTGTVEHRRVLGELREAARRLLTEAGHPANEATLRRCMTTLSALAAAGGFDPDRPGALQSDRDPPGFEALTLSFAPSDTPTPETPAQSAAAPAPQVEASAAPSTQELERAKAELAAQKVAEEARERAARAARERAARAARERAELQAELSEARALIETQRALVAQLHEHLQAEERELHSRCEAAAEFERRLAAQDEA